MTVTVQSFRQTKPAFNNPGIYPDLAVSTYIANAYNFLDPARWGASQDFGVVLYAAHHLVLDARDELTAAAGGIPGEVKGPATAKNVDKVGQSYDTKTVTFENAAFWNMTRYGIQLRNLAIQFGAGATQLGPGSSGAVLPFPAGYFWP
jgi:hypothetical protein